MHTPFKKEENPSFIKPCSNPSLKNLKGSILKIFKSS